MIVKFFLNFCRTSKKTVFFPRKIQYSTSLYFSFIYYYLFSFFICFIAFNFIRSRCSHMHFIISHNCMLSVYYCTLSVISENPFTQDMTGFTGRRNNEDAGTLVLQWHYDIAESQGSRWCCMVPENLFRALFLARSTCFRQIRLGPLSRTSSKHSEFFNPPKYSLRFF